MLPRCCRNLAVLDVLDRQHQVDDFARRGERVHVCKENLQLTLQVLDGGALNQLDGLAQHVGQLSRKVKQSTALVEAVAEGQNIVGAVEAGPCHVLERFCEDEIVRSILPHLGLVRVLVLERGASGQNASLGKQRHEAGQKFASGELDPAGFGVGDKSDLAELQSAAKEVDGRLLEDLELFRDLRSAKQRGLAGQLQRPRPVPRHAPRPTANYHEPPPATEGNGRRKPPNQCSLTNQKAPTSSGIIPLSSLRP
mmetsp:Transcript_24080/g.76874  ORF Transcript_24080/g.76874 Transcript_24080/m.76874 type:complete len:253 (+) Transcript_24080:130-888(+)